MNELTYKDYMDSSDIDKFNYFMNELSVTNRTPEYYVNWNKVDENVKKYELELNTLNYLIGKKDIYNETLKLFKKQPNLVSVIPILLGIREVNLDVLSMEINEDIKFFELDFRNTDINNIDKYVKFCENSGLLNFLKNCANRSLVDYIYGVEVGLDSNGRKNRSGTTMELIVEKNIMTICKELGLEYHTQVTVKYIKETWGIDVPIDKSKRRFDIVVYDSKNNKLCIIETNYYGGGGSKLKSVCGEFVNLNRLISNSKNDVTFIWITDGQGWKTAKRPILEAFEEIDNIYNLKMLKQGYLKEVLYKI